MKSHATGQTSDALAAYPALAAWYLSQQKSPPTVDNLPDYHLWALAKSLRSPASLKFRLWTQNVDQVLSLSGNFLEHILETDSRTCALGVSLTDLYAILAESALSHGEGAAAFKTLSKLADHCELAAFRFLSAWTAFNFGDLETCVAECEKINEPFSPIHTLMGQALLEAGQPLEAIDALKVAHQLTPSDALPLVQLIKAYLVTGIQSEAMKCVDKCRKILGHHIEIECLAAMTIMSGPNHTTEFCEKTLGQLAAHLEHEPADFEAFSIAMDLATELRRKDWAERFSNLAEFSVGASPHQLAAKVAKILKKTGELNWHELSRTIIDKTLVITKSAYSGVTQ